jgi:hypothetical protein
MDYHGMGVYEVLLHLEGALKGIIEEGIVKLLYTNTIDTS